MGLHQHQGRCGDHAAVRQLPFLSLRTSESQTGNRWGFIDKDGKYISSPNFLWATEFSKDFALVQTSDRVFALVNRSGKIVLLDKVEQLSYGFTARLIPAASGGKWGFIDSTGKWVIDPQFESVGNFADGLAPVKVGGRTGYIDEKGKFVVNPQYDPDYLSEFYDGYARFASAGKFGFIDTKGHIVSDAKFLDTGIFSDGLAPVKTEDGWGFIDKTGKMVVNPQFDTAYVFHNGLARVTVAGKEAYVTTGGAFVVDPFPGRTGIPTQPVHELWTGRRPDGALTHLQRFILIREGNQIRGYSYYNLSLTNYALELKGLAAQDGSFNMAAQDGTSWKGQFVSSVLIKGVRVNPPGASAPDSPMELHLARDATAEEWEPLPPTSSEWSIFLSSFKDAVQRRDFGALSRMMARSFSYDFVDHAKELARMNRKWINVDAALARGDETSSSTPWGSAMRTITDENSPCPGCGKYFFILIFSQDGDHQWRWAGTASPGG